MQTLRRSFLGRLFGKRQEEGTLGIYGVPNAGKTLLANRICAEWMAEELGVSSPVPHETRAVRRRDGIRLEGNGSSIMLNIVDTPGLASSVSPKELQEYCRMRPEEARVHAKEATEGIMAAIAYLKSVDGLLLVVDSTEDPHTQVNATLLAHARARRLPLVVAANKVDIPTARPDIVARAFAPYRTVPVSALTGQAFPELYDTMVEVYG